MKTPKTDNTFKRKNLELLAEEEVANLCRSTDTPLQIARLTYDEDYFEDPRISEPYKQAIARALNNQFGDLSIQLWSRK